MAKTYLDAKAEKKKTGRKALWALIILLVVVLSMILKIMLTGSLKADIFTGMPTSDQAYSVAKDFIKPTLKGSGADFSDSHYQFAKPTDSLYVIRSSVVTTDETHEKVTTKFKITMKFNGGMPTSDKNWTLINLDQN